VDPAADIAHVADVLDQSLLSWLTLQLTTAATQNEPAYLLASN